MELLVLSLVLGGCLSVPVPSADPFPAAYASDYSYYLPSPPAAPSSQYHAQDELGQYNYGFQSSDQAKTETKSADGVVRGAYRYVDANGLVQSVNYISDALGFRVAATNLPVHNVEGGVADAPAPVAVAAGPSEAVAAVAAVPSFAGVYGTDSVLAPQVSYAYLPYALDYNYNVLPSQYAVQPQAPEAVIQPVNVPANAPFVPAATQYHAQDELGQYTFGYNDENAARHESKTADGIVRGAYRYVDGDGSVQTVEYIADALGFRVAGTNLPIFVPTGPVDTPEVAAAKVQHAQLYSAASQAASVQPENEEANVASTIYYGAADGVPTGYVTQESAIPQAAAYYNAVVAPKPYVVPEVTLAAVASQPAVPGSQYHVQDEVGQYTYGYNDGNSLKQEVKSADGVVRGTYSYVDSNGLVQTVNYISDALGFRVGATNLPVHDVNEAVAATPLVETLEDLPVHSRPVISPQVSYAYLPYATNYGYNLPVNSASAPAVNVSPVVAAASPVVAPVVPSVDVTASQYHAQDELGQYNYGYSSDTQTKAEVKTADGVTRGSYSYVDANGLVQTVNYISDAMGFRVAATNLPVHVVEDEVVSTEGDAAVYEAKPASPPAVISPQVSYSYLPYAQNYAYNIPIGT